MIKHMSRDLGEPKGQDGCKGHSFGAPINVGLKTIVEYFCSWINSHFFTYVLQILIHFIGSPSEITEDLKPLQKVS